jgi:hypothetical protein
MNDEEPAPRETRLTDEEIKRLPQAVQLEIKLKRGRQQQNSVAFLTRERTRLRLGFCYGLIVFSLAHYYVLDCIPLVAVTALVGATAGYLIVKRRWNYIVAMLMFGGISIAGSMTGLVLGVMKAADLMFMAATWGVLCGAAMVLVHLIEGDRRKSEMF